MGTTKEIILTTIEDLVSDFVYYDRKESEYLSSDQLNAAVEAGEITVDEMAAKFRKHLEATYPDKNDPIPSFVKGIANTIGLFKAVNIYRPTPNDSEIERYKQLLLENEGLDCEVNKIAGGGSGSVDPVFVGYEICLKGQGVFSRQKGGEDGQA